MSKTVKLAYGRDGLTLPLPPHADVIRPRHRPGLADEAEAFRAALRQPLGSPPLAELIGPDETLAIVIADITRPLPTARLLPWLLAELPQLAPERVVIISGTGSHRVNTADEWRQLVGDEVVGKYRLVDHDSRDPDSLVEVGHTPDGRPVSLNREFVRADRRIIMGFIEPHFMAGFSGGYKAVFPGIADLDSIMHYHRASVIGDPRSCWGQLEDNPTQAQVRANGSLVPIDFCVNVLLNGTYAVTDFFCGEVMAAHLAGCDLARSIAMHRCTRTYPIVVTTNCGYPLDQNLYQTVKGMSAALQIVADGGLILTAAACADGFPEHGNFKQLLFAHDSPQAVLDTILAPGFSQYDQWEAQLLALICLRAHVALYSMLPADEVARAFIEPVADLGARLTQELERRGPETPVAVLPEGFATVPYIEP